MYTLSYTNHLNSELYFPFWYIIYYILLGTKITYKPKGYKLNSSEPCAILY